MKLLVRIVNDVFMDKMVLIMNQMPPTRNFQFFEVK